jgi:hypothetical protein
MLVMIYFWFYGRYSNVSVINQWTVKTKLDTRQSVQNCIWDVAKALAKRSHIIKYFLLLSTKDYNIFAKPKAQIFTLKHKLHNSEELCNNLFTIKLLNTFYMFDRKLKKGWQSSSSGKRACLASVKSWVQTPVSQKKKKTQKIENEWNGSIHLKKKKDKMKQIYFWLVQS